MDLPPVPWSCVSLLSFTHFVSWASGPYVTAGKVTTLEHEVGDDAVERGALVAEALLTSAESLEVGGGLGDNVVVQGEVDATGLLCYRRRVSARFQGWLHLHEVIIWRRGEAANQCKGRRGKAVEGLNKERKE